MQTAYVVSIYETGLRGRPVPRIGEGDLADPYPDRKSPWQRLASLWSAIVDVARETRELEARLLGRTSYRYFE